jgi:hypothetical protein
MTQKNTVPKKLTFEKLVDAQANLKYWLPRSEKLQGFYEIDTGSSSSLRSVIEVLGRMGYRLDYRDKIWTFWIKLDTIGHQEKIA